MILGFYDEAYMTLLLVPATGCKSVWLLSYIMKRIQKSPAEPGF
mgnify:CR=1